ncbi:acyl-ACP--UDP-N-acetylglucosamine O-acyltransferase [Sulfurovum sp. XGS-02]|uniref:acyl-ACP--UDP-N-acetylglucosamine O-acyltransferase n=1 Tax=Sulfurovum sp. XGS-02 TaxID=2925411 RepID=UPI002044F100|nr:acyl-ACP--UDP-N-acetylglucosamine O-acyltransferase [Sulfurovum sp. XGS-02]UPT76529.1 acyl-ACP--UDP-N-acetylglucosamine O-acyltransferase [Sulfurovum sp. XGS-02]
MSLIHASAVIEDGAILGENVSVGPFAYIGPNVKIGDNTTVATHAVIEGHTTIGKNNRIFPHAAVGTIPQDLKFAGERVELIIGDNNTIREFTLLNPGTKGGGSVTRIGNGNLLMGYVHLGHDVILGDNCILANGATLAGHVELGNHVVIGGLTPVHQFVHIGDYAMIGGASALSQDIPPFCLAEGNRANLRGLNLTGLRRAMDRKDINALKSAYRELFEEGKPLQEVAQRLFESTDSDKVKQLCEFIMTSKRGIPFTRSKTNEDK